MSDNTDCNDYEGASIPNNPEVCDSIDNDCNGAVDDGAFNTQLYYEDGDGDGFGDNSTVVETCSPPLDYVALGDDDDDNDNDINPNATEVCDGEDNNYDGLTDDSSSGCCLVCDADGDVLVTAHRPTVVFNPQDWCQSMAIATTVTSTLIQMATRCGTTYWTRTAMATLTPTPVFLSQSPP